MRWSNERLSAFVELQGFANVMRSTGIPKNSLASYMNGSREPKATSLAKLSLGMGLPMDAFFTVA